MNERNYKTITIVLAVLLLFNTWQLHSVKQELAELSGNYNNTLNQLQTDVRNIENNLDRQYNRINNLLTEQASLFSSTDVSMKLQGKQIAVTMRAVPKELQNNETLIARITADGKTYEQSADSNGTATILIDPVDSIQPGFVIQSPSGIRQEMLPEYALIHYISGYVQALWNHESETDDTMLLDFYLADMDGQPFTADEIAAAKCIVVNTGEQRDGETAVDTAIEITAPEQWPTRSQIPQGDELVAVKQTDSTEDTVHYQVNLADYFQRQDGIRYNVYFLLTTTDGITFFTRDSAIADFSATKDTSSYGSGGGALFPIFE